MKLEQQAHLRKGDMETNQHMAAVRKTCKNYPPREVQEFGWGTTVGGTLAMELQHIHHIIDVMNFVTIWHIFLGNITFLSDDLPALPATCC